MKKVIWYPEKIQIEPHSLEWSARTLPSSTLPWQISRESELDEDKKEHILLSNDENMHLSFMSLQFSKSAFFLISVLLFFSSCIKDIPILISTPSRLRQLWLPYTQEESSLITNTWLSHCSSRTNCDTILESL